MPGSEVLHARLNPGERLLWSGRPQQGLLIVRRHVILLPLIGIWLAGAIMQLLHSFESDATLVEVAIGSLLVAAGIYGLVGTLAMDAWVRGRTWYGLTDRRLLIDAPRRGGGFRDFNLADLPAPRLIQSWTSPSRGTVRFEIYPPCWKQLRLGGGGGHNFRVFQPSLDLTPQLLGILEPAKVAALLTR